MIPKGYKRTQKRDFIRIESNDYEIANLSRADRIHQSIIVINYGGKWHPIDCVSLGGDDSDLKKFVSHINLHNYTLADLGLKESYDLKQSDYIKLAEKYPFSAEDIEKLDKFFLSESMKSGIYEVEFRLKSFEKKGKTIDNYILETLNQKNQIIMEAKSKAKKELEATIDNEGVVVIDESDMVINESVSTETPNSEPVANNSEPQTKNPAEVRYRQRIAQIEAIEFKANYPKSCFEKTFSDNHTMEISLLAINTEPDHKWDSLVQYVCGYVPVKTAENIAPSQKKILESAEKFAAGAPEILSAGTGTSQAAKTVQLSDTNQTATETNQAVLGSAHNPNEVPQPVQAPQSSTETQSTQTPSEKKPITLDAISGLKPERFKELAGLREKQEKIVAENPIIKVVDKTTRDKAQAQVNTLLKASTAIDGKSGILTNFVTHANQFIKMGKDFLNPLAKITRDQLEKQRAEIIAFDEAEEIKRQKEQRELLEKIQKRTKILFEVPFGFNGEIYTIGTVHVLPSEIENLSDEEFLVKVELGRKIQQEIEANKAQQQQIESAKNAALIAAADELRKYNSEAADKILIDAGIIQRPTDVSAEPAASSYQPAPTQSESAQTSAAPVSPAAPVSNTPQQAPVSATQQATQPTTKSPRRFVPTKAFIEAPAFNTVACAFDMDHLDAISKNPIPEAYIVCRSYYIEGARVMAEQILNIMSGDKIVDGKKQSERIIELSNNIAFLWNTK